MKESTSATKTTKKDRFWVGMDDHAKTIVVAVVKAEETPPVARFTVRNDEKGQKELIKRLKELKGDVRCVYEAGPCGYGQYHGQDCEDAKCLVQNSSPPPLSALGYCRTPLLGAGEPPARSSAWRRRLPR